MNNTESENELLQRCKAKFSLRIEFAEKNTPTVSEEGLKSFSVIRSAVDRDTGETVYLKMFDVVHATWNMLLQRKLEQGMTEEEFKRGWADMQVMQMCHDLEDEGLV